MNTIFFRVFTLLFLLTIISCADENQKLIEELGAKYDIEKITWIDLPSQTDSIVSGELGEMNLEVCESKESLNMCPGYYRLAANQEKVSIRYFFEKQFNRMQINANIAGPGEGFVKRPSISLYGNYEIIASSNHRLVIARQVGDNQNDVIIEMQRR